MIYQKCFIVIFIENIHRGTDFYNKKIINMIEPFFERNDKIKYRKLCMEEIELLLKKID